MEQAYSSVTKFSTFELLIYLSEEAEGPPKGAEGHPGGGRRPSREETPHQKIFYAISFFNKQHKKTKQKFF